MIDGLSIFAPAAQCARATPADTTASVAFVERGGEPLAVEIDSERINVGSLEEGILTNFGSMFAKSASKRRAETRSRVIVPTPTPHTEASSPKWDVFSSNKYHPLLDYQGTRK